MKRMLVIGAVAAMFLSMGGALFVAQGQTNLGSGKEAPAPQASIKSQPLPRMVDVGKTWCIPCKKMVAVLQEAELRYKGKATIEFVDLEKDPDAADRYKIQMIPTQIFYTVEGKEFERHIGFLPFEDVEKIFKKMGVDRST
jgi:thioredoxin 1